MKKIYSKIKNRSAFDVLICIIEYSIGFLIAFLNGSVWSRLLVDNNPIIHLSASLLIVILAVIYAIKNGTSVRKKHVILILTFGICIALTLVKNVRSIIDVTLFLYIPIVASLLLAAFMQPEDFWRLTSRFIKVMLVIAVVSLFFWTFGSVLKMIPYSKAVTFDWDGDRAGYSYFGLYYEPLWMRINIPEYGVFQRNCGIYTETPMYCFLLSNAYCLYRLQQNQKKWIIVVFCATIASAVNITAIVAIILFEIIRYALGMKLYGRRDIFKFIVLPCIGLIGIYSIFALIETKLGSFSGSVRLDHLESCVKTFVSSFPLGAGYGTHGSIVGLGSYNQGISLGLPYLFAQQGVPAIIMISVPSAYLFAKAVSTKNWSIVAFVTALLWSLFCTSVVYRCHLYWLLICYFVNWGTSLKIPEKLTENERQNKKHKRIQLFGRNVVVGK